MVTFMKSLQERFDEKTKVDPSGCILWTGAQTRPGERISYGKISVEGKQKTAHVTAVYLATGEWPAAGMEVDHLCNVTLCVNVDHLEVVTRLENNRRRRKGWTSRKDRSLCTKGLHPWVDDNLIARGGYLTCKRCCYDRNNEWHHRNKEAS